MRTYFERESRQVGGQDKTMATMSEDDLKTTSRKVSEKQKWNLSSLVPSLPTFFTKRSSKKRREGGRERREEENVPDAQQSNSGLLQNSQVEIIAFFIVFSYLFKLLLVKQEKMQAMEFQRSKHDENKEHFEEPNLKSLQKRRTTLAVLPSLPRRSYKWTTKYGESDEKNAIIEEESPYYLVKTYNLTKRRSTLPVIFPWEPKVGPLNF